LKLGTSLMLNALCGRKSSDIHVNNKCQDICTVFVRTNVIV